MTSNRYMWCLPALLLASGCTTYSLEELRKVKPTGSPFQAELAKRYLAFSEEEARVYDWADSSYFADKGLAAAYGKDVQPEPLENRSLPQARVAELQAARDALLEVLKAKGAEKPAPAAAAQVFFDCWVENAEEDWQPDEIAYCRDGFEEAMKTLTYEPPPPPPAPEPTPEPAPAPVEPIAPPPPPPPPAAEAPKKQSYLVLFGFNIAILDEPGRAIVNTVAEDLLKDKEANYTVILNGHADTVGTDRYNMALSKRRAEAVQAVLVSRGIAKEKIKVFAFGETDPAVPTPDNTREPANRRVEIFLGD